MVTEIQPWSQAMGAVPEVTRPPTQVQPQMMAWSHWVLVQY